ncbi:MAG: hypothetical protein JW727_03460 [Candidatus Aenigmarchaeota archaeon]|nr:hypothetical protein [Candidatus Aenigmarchaeota archaeon]
MGGIYGSPGLWSGQAHLDRGIGLEYASTLPADVFPIVDVLVGGKVLEKFRSKIEPGQVLSQKWAVGYLDLECRAYLSRDRIRLVAYGTEDVEFENGLSQDEIRQELLAGLCLACDSNIELLNPSENYLW